MTAVFYISSVVAIFSTLIAITRANAVHGVLNLVVSFLAVAVVLFSIGASFAAALEVIIYAGAIMVVFVFVVMMLNDPQATEREKQRLRPGVWLIPGILAALLLAEVIWLICSGSPRENISPGKSPVEVGMLLFGPYLLGVELVSVVLMTGLVGACHLGRKQKNETNL